MLSLRGLWNRHRRKLFITLGALGGGYVIYKFYDAHRRRVTLLERQLEGVREVDELIKSQLQNHFENIQRISDTTTLPYAMHYLKSRIAADLDVSYLTEKLRQAKGQYSTLTTKDKAELWERLKILSFTRLTTSVWSMTVLCLYVKVLVNILGRHLYVDIARGSESSETLVSLDDLRDWTNNVQPFIPIYVAKHDFEVMKMTHYYLVDTSVVLEGAAVSELQFNIIKEEPFIVHNLKITPLPVWHGQGYRSLGFRFGDICYISDVSEIPEETYLLLKDCDLLILDALRPDRSSSTHFGLPRALEEVRKIRPKRTLFTGMMHLMDHEEISEDLAKLKKLEGLDLQLSYDGLTVPVNL